MRDKVEEAVGESAEHWHAYIVESMPTMEGETEEDSFDVELSSELQTRTKRIRRLISLARLLTADLRGGCVEMHALFNEQLGVHYLGEYFEVYQREITAASRRIVESTCEMLKPISVAPGEEGVGEYGQQKAKETLAVGTLLFELYITFQQLTE